MKKNTVTVKDGNNEIILSEGSTLTVTGWSEDGSFQTVQAVLKHGTLENLKNQIDDFTSRAYDFIESVEKFVIQNTADEGKVALEFDLLTSEVVL